MGCQFDERGQEVLALLHVLLHLLGTRREQGRKVRFGRDMLGPVRCWLRVWCMDEG